MNSELMVPIAQTDTSAYTETLLPQLLSSLPRGITLWHGLKDSILFALGERITIQNLTWGGAQVRFALALSVS